MQKGERDWLGRMLRCAVALGIACAALTGWAQVRVSPAGWALELDFPGAAAPDEQRTPTPYGEEVAQRHIAELAGERYMAIRFVYPVVPLSSEQRNLYLQSVETIMRSRPGTIRAESRFALGAYQGHRVLIEHRREKSMREIRMVLIGASLYVFSAESPGNKAVSPAAQRFLEAAAVRPEFTEPRLVEDRERWREIGAGNFRLRYDGSRWYRDPTDAEPDTVNLLRVDQVAEAQFIAERERRAAATMEEEVLAVARESGESVAVRRRAKKLRGAANVEDLEFTVRLDGTTFVNRGYFYTGPQGTVQLRAWSAESAYAKAAGEISELLDGLVIAAETAAR